MQKISSYLYPNRVELIADLVGFTVEFTSVYQRNVKIYNGIDNTIEFDIKNADQKRIDLSTLSHLELNIMDVSGSALPDSPFALTQVLDATGHPKKGIARVTIPQESLEELSPQFLRYSVSAIKDGHDVLLYADTRFGAVGTIELLGDALPTFRDPKVYKTFTGEIDFMGKVVYHTSSIPTTFYEAVATDQIWVEIAVTGFVGTIWIEGTTNSTISVNSYLHAQKINIPVTPADTILRYTLTVGDLKYFRVLYQGNSPINPTGTVDKVTIS